jgi:ABC-type amino acid transport substrate-binding protein
MPPVTSRRAVLAAGGGALSLTTGCLGRLTAAPIAVGVTLPNRPFALRSRCCTWETAELTGFDVEVARALGGALDRPVEFAVHDASVLRSPPTEWPFDAAMDGRIVPPEPPADHRYVGPYLRGYHTVLVPAASAPTLRGRTVAVATDRAARAAERLVSAVAGDLEVRRFPGREPARAALGADVAGVVDDHVTNALAVARADDLALLERGTVDAPDAGRPGTPFLALGADEYAVVVAPDDPLGDRLAGALDSLRGAGRLAALRDRYFTDAGLPRRDAF